MEEEEEIPADQTVFLDGDESTAAAWTPWAEVTKKQIIGQSRFGWTRPTDKVKPPESRQWGHHVEYEVSNYLWTRVKDLPDRSIVNGRRIDLHKKDPKIALIKFWNIPPGEDLAK